MSRKTITISNELAEACLRATAKAGFPSVAQGLLDAGVNPDALCGAALTIAERYGHAATIAVLRNATTDRAELLRRETLAAKLRKGAKPSRRLG